MEVEMIDQQTMLGIIRTEAIEGPSHHGRPIRPYPSLELPKKGSEGPSVEYNLRLVKKADGSYEWRDD